MARFRGWRRQQVAVPVVAMFFVEIVDPCLKLFNADQQGDRPGPVLAVIISEVDVRIRAFSIALAASERELARMESTDLARSQPPPADADDEEAVSRRLGRLIERLNLVGPEGGVIEYQGEYVRLQPQDESDNSELVHAVIADWRFDNP